MLISSLVVLADPNADWVVDLGGCDVVMIVKHNNVTTGVTAD